MNVREICVNIVMDVHQGSYLNLSLNQYLKEASLSSRDSELVTRIVYSCFTHLLTLQYGIDQYVGPVKLRPFEKAVVLVSYTQMVYFDKVPSYAIINDAVNIVKKKRGAKAAGFINRLLHQLDQHHNIEINVTDDDEYLSIYYSHPLWLVKMLKAQYGIEATKKILIENQTVPSLASRVNRLKISLDEVRALDASLLAGNLSPDALLFTQGNIAFSSLYQQGFVTIQDEASQMVAPLLDPKPHSKVLDMCAAPGSKTCHLSALMENTGEIHAYDLHEHKIALILNNAKRLGCTNIQARAYDSTHLLDIEEVESFDYILCDAPCSGLGVLSRKPEIRYKDSNAMDELIEIQYHLLETAAKLLKVGGSLVYSTCTINKKENTKNVDRFLLNHPNFKKIEERQLLNYEFHSDGFYMVKMVKE